MPTKQLEPQVRSQTLGAEVADRLRKEILSGALAPGVPLREIPLAKRYGASRQTIREALRSLSDLGLVDLHARRGARIVAMSPRRAREVYTLRSLLEPFALRTALIEGRIRGEEMAQIEQAFAAMVESAGRNDISALIEADMAFHWALCAPCGHGMLLETLKRLQHVTRQSMVHMKVYGSDAEGEVESHTPILRAVRDRDADGAAAAVRDHINAHGERLLMKLLEQHEDAAE
jgi:DNA-binding GntR family transcriptional regulator